MPGSGIRIPYDINGRTRELSAYILNPARKPICQINGTVRFDVSAKFNDISEIDFEVPRYSTNASTMESQETAAYKYLHSFCQILVPELGNYGYFIIHEEPTITAQSTKEESKTFTAKSYESVLEFENLVLFHINEGTETSKEMYEENLDTLGFPTRKIQLFNETNKKLSLLDLVLADDYYGWQVGHVDTSIKGLERSFEIDNQNVYSFLRSDVTKAFRCLIDFDTKNKLINAYDIETVGSDTNIYLSIEHYLDEISIAPHSENC